MNNFILHTIKYLIVTVLVWGAMRLSDVHFAFLSCALLGFAAALLEWMFKVWMVDNLEKLATMTVRAINNNTNKAVNDSR